MTIPVSKFRDAPQGVGGPVTPGIICILGMHRSGTSLTARLLNLIGVCLGPQERLVEAASANPKGFWEHRRFVNINNKILWKLGGHTHEPPFFAPGWEDSADLDDLRERALTFIREDFADKELWGWKDPRTCLTLQFWQRLLQPMHYVICIRHPFAVAESLIQRDRLSLARSVNLWLVYLQSALVNTTGQPRILTFYDDILDDWLPEMRRLGQFVGRPGEAEQPSVRMAAEEFIDANLRHHLTHRPETGDGPDSASLVQLLDIVQKLYQVLERERESFGQPEIERMLRDALDIGRLQHVRDS